MTLNEYGLEIKEANFIFIVSFSIFFLVFVGLIYRNCIQPGIPPESWLSLGFAIFFSGLSYLFATLFCVIYTDYRTKE